MMDISVYITLNNKTDLNKVTAVLRNQHIDKPIYIIDLGDSFRINFDSDYEHFEIETEVKATFTDYEFVSDLGKGLKEIKMTIHRIQSPFSSDGWGRQFNSDAIESTIYLVRKSRTDDNISDEVNTTFKVLLGDIEKEYTVNAVPGINKSNNEKGFILVKPVTSEDDKAELIENTLFKTKSDAFWRGFNLMTIQIEQEFEDYKKSIKRKRKKK